MGASQQLTMNHQQQNHPLGRIAAATIGETVRTVVGTLRFSGIPETDEQTDQVILEVANKLNTDIDDRDIDKLHRVDRVGLGKTPSGHYCEIRPLKCKRQRV